MVCPWFFVFQAAFGTFKGSLKRLLPRGVFRIVFRLPLRAYPHHAKAA
ncbi:hypothetical protein [uncultured Kingella sp.]|nr:hypothetical protein [uncultured Kingella sp.]